MKILMGTIVRPRKTMWLLLCLIFLNNLWSYSHIELKVFQYIHLLILCFFIFTCVYNYNKICIRKNYQFVIWDLLLMLLPLFSILSCHYLHGQSYISSFIIYRMHLGWLLYFVLIGKCVSEKQLIYVIVFIAIVYTIIVMIEQLTYPFAPFGDRTIGTSYSELMGGVERRFGFWRFSVGGYRYAILALFLFFNKKWKVNKFIIILLIMGIIATGNRQTIVATFGGIIFYYLFSRNIHHKYFYLLLLGIVIVVSIIYGNQLYGHLADVSNDLEEGRMHSYIYYWMQVTSNWPSFLFGNGLAANGSTYALNADMYFMNKLITPSDVGLLGTWYYWGFIYISIYVILIVRLLLSKYLSIHLKAFCIYILLTLWVSSPLWEIWGMSFQALFLYYCDLDVRKNKTKLKI